MNRLWLDRIIVIVVLLIGATLRIWLSTRGHNYDLDMWRGIADVAARGQNIYLSTHPVYDKPPSWFLIIGGLDRVHSWIGAQRLGPESFHIVVASLLTLADVGIGLMLLRVWGRVPFLFFFLNPVSILLTGYHSQYDNLALLPALASWLLITPRDDRQTTWPRVMAAALLLGVSLTIKHIMIFFPIWLLLSPTVLKAMSQRIAFAGVAFGILIGSFVPFVFTPGVGANVLRNVVEYSRISPDALMPCAIELVAPLRTVDSLFGLLPSSLSAVKYFFHTLILIAGWLFARRRMMDAHELFAAYLCSLLIFTSVMNQNYLAIPLIACAIHWRRIGSWIYCILAACVVEMSAYVFNVLPGPPWWKNILPGLAPRHAVVWLIVLLIAICRRRNEETPPAARHV